jgi:hypothetical protein
MTADSSPQLTVVVALVSGSVDHLRSCLSSLEKQRFPGLEILVPYDDPVADVTSLGDEFPLVEFIHAEGLDTAAARSGSSREHHDSIRTVGLRRARGCAVAMLEDVGEADPGWCRGLLDALERHPDAGAVGGGMGCGSARLLNRAVCLSDFWRYQLPLPESTSPFASDANIAYRRDVLESLREVWEDDFHETVVNEALFDRGYQIWLTPAATVYQQRGRLKWGEAIKERIVWGRSYGGTRVKGISFVKRLPFAAICPLLPAVLTSRVVRIAWRRGNFWSGCFPALPTLILLFIMWSYGEMVGYLSGRPV